MLEEGMVFIRKDEVERSWLGLVRGEGAGPGSLQHRHSRCRRCQLGYREPLRTVLGRGSCRYCRRYCPVLPLSAAGTALYCPRYCHPVLPRTAPGTAPYCPVLPRTVPALPPMERRSGTPALLSGCSEQRANVVPY